MDAFKANSLSLHPWGYLWCTPHIQQLGQDQKNQSFKIKHQVPQIP